MQPETLFKEKVQEFLKSLPYCWTLKTNERSVRGIPDILICLRGQFIALELKVGENVADPLQQFYLDKIKAAGGFSLVVWPATWHQVMPVLLKIATGQLTIRGVPEDMAVPTGAKH